MEAFTDRAKHRPTFSKSLKSIHANLKVIDMVSKGSGLIRLIVSIVATVWMIFWCYIGLELDDKYRSEDALTVCVGIGLAGLYPIFLSLVILLNPDEPIRYHGDNWLVRLSVSLVNRFVIKPKRRATKTDDHDLSMDFDEYQSLDTDTHLDLRGGDQLDGKAVDQSCMDPPKRNFLVGIPRRTKWLVGTLGLALLVCGFLSTFTALTPNPEFKPASRADLQNFQINEPSSATEFFTHTFPFIFPGILICVLPIYLLISGKMKY